MGSQGRTLKDIKDLDG